MPTEHTAWRIMRDASMKHFWFKCFGITGFIVLFLLGYLYLLKNPAAAVTLMPVTAVDRLIAPHPLALPLYLSLWAYVSLAPGFMETRRDIVEYGAWIGAMCAAGLAIFYVWPSAVPPAALDWARYPGMAFLKAADGAGNACPSLHAATAVFTALCLHGRLPALGLGRGARLLNAAWCLAILYSTLATKQHMAVDVAGGAALGGAFALMYLGRGMVWGNSRRMGGA